MNLKTNKLLIRFFEWLYFPDNDFKIIKIKGINVFLCDKNSNYRATISPIWDKKRVIVLFKRFLRIKNKENKEWIS